MINFYIKLKKRKQLKRQTTYRKIAKIINKAISSIFTETKKYNKIKYLI